MIEKNEEQAGWGSFAAGGEEKLKNGGGRRPDRCLSRKWMKIERVPRFNLISELRRIPRYPGVIRLPCGLGEPSNNDLAEESRETCVGEYG